MLGQWHGGKGSNPRERVVDNDEATIMYQLAFGPTPIAEVCSECGVYPTVNDSEVNGNTLWFIWCPECEKMPEASTMKSFKESLVRWNFMNLKNP